MAKERRLFPILLVPLLLAAPVHASATAVCEQLRQNLAGTTQVIGNTGEARKYSSAINQQNLEIRRLRSDLRRFGCSSGSIVVIGGDNEGMCDQAEADLKRLEDNKRLLMRKRNDMRGGSDAGGRTGILTALRENGCNEPQGIEPMMQPDVVTLDDDTDAPAGTVPVFGAIARQPSGLLPLEGTVGQATLRTLCVRTCDGAFFPISSNATAQSFGRDANTCAQMCPGTATELYYHSMLGAESADMISTATGQPYTALPTAFAYRNRPAGKGSACGCNLSAYYQEMLRRENAGKNAVEDSHKAVTEIHSAVTPKTQDHTVDHELTLPEDRPYDPAKSKVRQVGPQFLGDDSASIDLRNPKDTGPQPLQ